MRMIHENEIPKERYISPKERQNIIDNNGISNNHKLVMIIHQINQLNLAVKNGLK